MATRRASRIRRIGIAGALAASMVGAWRITESLRPARESDVGAQASRVAPIPASALRPELVHVSGGSALIGSPEDEPGRDSDEALRAVEISPFWVARTEISQGQFMAVLSEDAPPVGVDDAGTECAPAGVAADLPVVCVSWHDAVRFCNRLSELEGIQPAYEPIGVGMKIRFPGLAPVDFGPPNAAGLLGVGGNAAEWVWDRFAVWYDAPLRDPSGPDDSPLFLRVIRGASWAHIPRIARLAARRAVNPYGRSVTVGFRIARSQAGNGESKTP